MAKIKDIENWRLEIETTEKWKKENFGVYNTNEHSGVGENIDYFDRGVGLRKVTADVEIMTTLNLVHAITKNIVPSLIYKNPKIMATPKKAEFQAAAPVVSHTLNHFYSEIDAEEINQKIIWDAYVLGLGVYKIGYATKFGVDFEDEKKKKKSLTEKAMEKIGLKKKEEAAEEHPEINYNIVSEKPYIEYISPFDYGRDYRASSLEESFYWYHKVKRTVKQMKENPKFKNTKDLQGQDPVDVPLTKNKMPQVHIDAFKTIDLYEIHYKNKGENYLLYISKDGEVYSEHYHEKSIYEMDEWQCDELSFNKHGHDTFAISDISKIKNLQDRFTNTIDSILEQVDKFVPKISANENDLTPEGKLALRDGDIGSIVWTTKNPREVIHEVAFTQVKSDLKVLADQIIDIVTIQTGLTRTQLTGVSQAETATEATIQQGGQTLRISDMNNHVNRFLKKQAVKLWKVVKQFVDLEELELINGETGVDENGLPLYSWLSVDEITADRMINGEYDFDIEVGSTQKPDLLQVRKQFENLFSILARSEVIMIMQQQGDKIVISELLKMYLNLFPEAVKDIGKIIQKITPQTQGLIPPEQAETRGGQTAGSNFNTLEKQAFTPAPGAGAVI